MIDTRLVEQNNFLQLGRGEVELDSHHALTSGVLQVFEDTLVSGVVGHDETKTGCCVECLTEPIDGELAAVVREWMQDHGGVLASFDNLIQVTDGTLTTARVSGPSTHEVSPPRSKNLPTRSAVVRSS